MGDNRVLTLMGGAHVNAMQGLATGNRAGKPAERKQEIHTPDCLLDVVREVFGGSIKLDPCASAAQDAIAEQNAYGEIINGREIIDGLKIPWVDGTYFNPPYKDLKAWLAKSTAERVKFSEDVGFYGAFDQIGLFPVRTNRAWWVQYMTHTAAAIAWLKPLKFKDYEQAFPAPLVLVYTNSLFGKTQIFSSAVRKSGLAHEVTIPLRPI